MWMIAAGIFHLLVMTYWLCVCIFHLYTHYQYKYILAFKKLIGLLMLTSRTTTSSSVIKQCLHSWIGSPQAVSHRPIGTDQTTVDSGHIVRVSASYCFENGDGHDARWITHSIQWLIALRLTIERDAFRGHTHFKVCITRGIPGKLRQCKYQLTSSDLCLMQSHCQREDPGSPLSSWICDSSTTLRVKQLKKS